MRQFLAFLLVATWFAAAPLAAQTFDLPPGSTPTPAPDVEGPVDDTGVVPVGPRAIPTARPTPTPVASPTPQPIELPAPVETPTARPTTDPRSRFGPAPAQSAPTAQPTQSPIPLNVPPPVALPSAQATPSEPSTYLPTQSAPSGMPELAVNDASEIPWLWLLAALGAVLTIGAGVLFMRRRADAPTPTIEPPIVGDALAGANVVGAAKPRFELMLDVERVTRSMMMLTVKYHLVVANRSDRALRDLAVHADLTSAKSGASEAAQLASVDTQMPLAETVERIGPHQSRTLTGTLQIPIQDLSIFAHGRHPAVVPLVRVRVGSDVIEPVAQTFVVGLPSDTLGARFLPLSLEGPPGGYEGVRAKALA